MHLFMDTDIIANAISLLGGYRLPLHLRGTYIFLHHIATAASNIVIRSCFAKRESNKTANFIQLHTTFTVMAACAKMHFENTTTATKKLFNFKTKSNFKHVITTVWIQLFPLLPKVYLSVASFSLLTRTERP